MKEKNVMHDTSAITTTTELSSMGRLLNDRSLPTLRRLLVNELQAEIEAARDMRREVEGEQLHGSSASRWVRAGACRRRRATEDAPEADAPSSN
jgi:hypothetical protein